MRSAIVFTINCSPYIDEQLKWPDEQQLVVLDECDALQSYWEDVQEARSFKRKTIQYLTNVADELLEPLESIAGQAFAQALQPYDYRSSLHPDLRYDDQQNGRAYRSGYGPSDLRLGPSRAHFAFLARSRFPGQDPSLVQRESKMGPKGVDLFAL